MVSKEPVGVLLFRVLLGLAFAFSTFVFFASLFGGPKEGGSEAMLGASLFIVLSSGFLLVSYTIQWLLKELLVARLTPEERRAEIRDALVAAAERRREPAAAPQAERTTGQPTPR
jgi:hypothetical protein